MASMVVVIGQLIRGLAIYLYMLTSHVMPCHACMVLHAIGAWSKPGRLQGAMAAKEAGTMPRTTSKDKRPQRACSRRRFPARRLHLVDIENLVGNPRPNLSQIHQALGLYTDRLAFGAMDQVEVASSHLTLLNAALGWPHARHRAQSGPDGADLALLDVLRHENVAQRFTHVAIASGDHLFAEEAAHLAAQGVWVTVVSRRHSLSPRLALAAREVIFLDTAAEAA